MPSEIRAALKKLKDGKTSGLDVTSREIINARRKTDVQAMKTLTSTVHRPTKSSNGKSNYVIEAGTIWARNRCPGSDARVACKGWTVHCGAGTPGSYPRGTPIFGPLPFRGDSLETKNGSGVFGLNILNTSFGKFKTCKKCFSDKRTKSKSLKGNILYL